MSLRSVKKKHGPESKRCSRVKAPLGCEISAQALRDRLQNCPATDVTWDSKLNKFRLVYAESAT
jgi:hypothetical protein